MIRHTHWLVLAMSGLVLCAAAYFFWHTSSDYSGLESNPNTIIEFAVGDEPITPIPLDLKLDKRKVSLGRRLFHDSKLSHDNKISCAHCHNLSKGGMDGLPRAIGIDGVPGVINTLTVFNSGFNFRLFWDGRSATLEDQLDLLLQRPMATTWPEVISKLELDAVYRRDFSAIYPQGIQPASIKDAIATFERSLITPNAKFDRYLRGDKQALDRDELAGYELFKSLGCISCHQGMNVGGNMYEKLGLVANYFARNGPAREVDFGRYNLSKTEQHRYEFRVPSLRNVALTAPYFHDGSASTLEKAVATMAKYQLGVVLQDGEIVKLVKFLNTLTGVYPGETGE